MKKPYIIKDYWAAEDHDSEDVIYRLICDDIVKTSEKSIFLSSTLTPIASERVKIGKSDEHTRNTILRGEDPDRIFKLGLSKEKSETKPKPEKCDTISWRNIEHNTREAVKRMDANR